jgi:FkbM family methyltransferase
MNQKQQFSHLLSEKIITSIQNDFKDNFDNQRFGKTHKTGKSLWKKLKDYIRKILMPDWVNKYEVENILIKTLKMFQENGEKSQKVYDLLTDDESKKWFLELSAYYIMSYQKIKLPTNNDTYWKNIEKIKANKDLTNKFESGIMNTKLSKFNLRPLGIPIDILLRTYDILHNIVLEQYNYKNKICAEKDDVIIDAGACWGDTALYFAHKVGNGGRIYSFEFIPKNIEILSKNLALNPNLKNRISLIQYPLWHTKGETVYYWDRGSGSRVALESFENYENSVETHTIDDFCEESHLEKIDFIKMDIEGAELNALKGAIRTIKKYKPKLAITSYHSLNDFVEIPLWIENLGLGYKIYLDHFTIHWEETVIFAKVE